MEMDMVKNVKENSYYLCELSVQISKHSVSAQKIT